MIRQSPSSDAGFTLVELVISIIIVAALATIVVFAVGGASDDAESTACDADAEVLATAQEVYSAQHGSYATEAELVAAGMLRSESRLNDISLDGDEFTINTVAGCTAAGPPPPATPASASTTTSSSTSTLPPVPTSTTVAPTTTSTSTSTTTTSTTTSTSTSTSTRTTSTTTLPPTTMPPTTTIDTTTTTEVPSLRLVFTVQPTSTPQSATITPAITVSVRDANNNAVTDSTATVTLSITPGTGSPAGRLTCTANPKPAVNGAATFSGCSINKRNAGYTLTATAPGLSSATSAIFNIT